MIWFGSKEYMTWVKTPDSGMGRDSESWSTSGVYLNGGGYSVQSHTSHLKPELTWAFATSADAATIRQFKVGAHGPGPFYWVDPFAMEVNVLPAYWSVPRLAVSDAPALVDTRPTEIATPTNTLGLPSHGALYTLTGSDTAATIDIPIPPGYELHFGWFGSLSGTAVVTLDGSSVTPMLVSSTSRTNVVSASTSGWASISAEGDGTLTIYGMQALILPTGTTAPTGGFRIGEGHSGCVFESLTEVGYSAPSARDYQSLTANFREVGAWV